MRCFVIAIVFSAVAQAAGAQCDSEQTVAAKPMPNNGNLIKTAVVQTPASAAARASTSQPGSSNQQPKRDRRAMLLATLALMSGIALRRLSSPNQ